MLTKRERERGRKRKTERQRESEFIRKKNICGERDSIGACNKKTKYELHFFEGKEDHQPVLISVKL